MAKDTIAVCIVRMDENVQSDSIKAITQRANEQGLHVEIFNSFVELTAHDLHDRGEESIYELIEYKNLCGIILFPEKIKNEEINQRIIQYGKEHDLPVISVDRYIPECVSITYDYANAFEEIVEHIIVEHGCESFYIMGGMRNNSFSDERIAAAKRVIARHGLHVDDDYIGYGNFWEAPCRDEMERFFASGKKLPDAFIAANDTMAMVICDELSKHGIRVPEDVIVTGFDGIDMEKYAVPRLTTAETDLETSGYIAVDTIIRLNRSVVDSKKHYVVPFHTRYSQSCGCEKLSFLSANSKIQELYGQLVLNRRFFDFMSDMEVGMTSCDNLRDMMKCIDPVLPYIYGFDDMYICLRKDAIIEDTGLISELVYPEDFDKNVSGLLDRTMVLFWETHPYSASEFPLEVFKMREQFPKKELAYSKNQNIVYLPLHVQDKVFGYMIIGVMPQDNNYLYYELNYLSRSISHSISSVLQTLKIKNSNEKLKVVNQKMEILYVTDPLTNINNRRGFYQEIEDKRSEKLYKWIFMVSIDLDGLKTINDNYGHLEGDKAITAIAEIISGLCDERTVCARFGGDEFCLCRMHEEFVEGAEDRFRNDFRNALDEFNKKSGYEYLVDASCGVSYSELKDDSRLEEFLKKADSNMYSEKEQHHKKRRED